MTAPSLLSACSRADGWSNAPGRPGILARGSLQITLRLPVDRQWLPARTGFEGDAPRLQWRHRVGFSPTSRDRPETWSIQRRVWGGPSCGHEANTKLTKVTKTTKNSKVFLVVLVVFVVFDVFRVSAPF